MNTHAPQSSTARTVFRVLGIVLVTAGLLIVVKGGMAVADDIRSTSMEPNFGPVVTLIVGGFMTVIGLGLLNVGFLGAQARYTANETAPAMRTAGSAWRGDDAVTCSRCGAGSRSGARFCDACGHGLG